MSHYRNPDEADRHHSHGVAEREAYEEEQRKAAERAERRERIANKQMAALWVALSNTTTDCQITREDVAAEAIKRADALIAALDGKEGGEK